MDHKIKPIIGKGTLDFPNNWGRVKHRIGFGSFNLHLRTSLKALRIDTALIYHAALLGRTVSVLFVETETLAQLWQILHFLQFTQFYNAKSEQKASNST